MFEPSFLEDDQLFGALDRGAPDLPLVVPSGGVVIAAAGVWGRYGSVVALRRDGQDGDALLSDVHLVERSVDGQWLAPDSCSGSGLPEWVLRRHDGPLPDSHSSDLTNLGAQMAHVGGSWLAELTVVASRAISTVEIRYGGEEITAPVPPGGLVTLPGLVRSPDDVAEFRGFDDTGEPRSVAYYSPLTESDRKVGWPAESLWAS
uniref:hypothetical protein n=1 Tax=Paractinoplanes polyasparticus TaxID=2856853 RepID=UPI001C8507D0|nr:hypothetical protein [Actinoplanes polyasparticus]